MNLFVYGTLMLPEIRDTLLSKRVKYKPAILLGYSAYTFFKDNSESEYPVLRIEKNGVLNGYVLEQISDNDYKILRYYEGEEYSLKKVDVLVNNTSIRSNTFITSNSCTLRYGSKWSLDKFAQNHLKYYLHKVIPKLLEEII